MYIIVGSLSLCSFFNTECFTSLHAILAQWPCLSSWFHSNFIICAAKVSTVGPLFQLSAGHRIGHQYMHSEWMKLVDTLILTWHKVLYILITLYNVGELALLLILVLFLATICYK